MTYSTNKDFNQFIKTLVKSKTWQYVKNGKSKHAYLRHVQNNARCPLPFSPKGDKAALVNFQKQIQRLERQNASQRNHYASD